MKVILSLISSISLTIVKNLSSVELNSTRKFDSLEFNQILTPLSLDKGGQIWFEERIIPQSGVICSIQPYNSQ